MQLIPKYTAPGSRGKFAIANKGVARGSGGVRPRDPPPLKKGKSRTKRESFLQLTY